MKKLKILLTTALVSIFAFCMLAFAACGGNAAEIAGSYELSQVNYNDEFYQLGQEADGVLVSKDTVTAELSEDGSMILYMNAMTKDGQIINRETMPGSWKETDDGLVFTFGRFNATGRYEDGYLQISIPGAATYHLTKK